MAFATWISPEFQLYIMKDYRRLKQDENSRLSLDWNLNRALSKVNYRIHTDAVKENLIPPELTPEQIAYTYVSEADLLNVALLAIRQMDTLASINLSAVWALPGGDIYEERKNQSIFIHPCFHNHADRWLFSGCTENVLRL
jgi:hypothetical protein